MAIYKTRGIVLKTFRLGEADRIVSILSETRGQVRAVAKGIRKTKSKFGARLEPFSFDHFVLYEGRGDLDTITQVDTIRPFSEVRESLERVTYGSAMLDLAERSSQQGERDVRLLRLLLAGLEALAETPVDEPAADPPAKHAADPAALDRLLLAFDLKYLAVGGLLPQLSTCQSCGGPLVAPAKLSLHMGGMTCARCAAADSTARALPRGAKEKMEALIRTPLAEAGAVQMTPADAKKVGAIIQAYMAYHLETRLKSREYLARRR